MWICYCKSCGEYLKKKSMFGGFYYIWEDCQSCYLRHGINPEKLEKFVYLSQYLTWGY